MCHYRKRIPNPKVFAVLFDSTRTIPNHGLSHRKSVQRDYNFHWRVAIEEFPPWMNVGVVPLLSLSRVFLAVVVVDTMRVVEDPVVLLALQVVV
jgi:hypothetical protein